MKYLRKFATEAEYEAYKQDEYQFPNVSLIADTSAVKYNLLLGVFIQHIDGNLYTTDEWKANGFTTSQANGVAVRDREASFVIAKTNISSRVWSSNIPVDIEGVLATDDKATAFTDYKGKANTAKIIETSAGGAALACSNYIFPNGSKGYLPALGEWGKVINHYEEISTALAQIEGTTLSNYFWTSTQNKTEYAWRCNPSANTASSAYKASSYASRPFTTL